MPQVNRRLAAAGALALPADAMGGRTMFEFLILAVLLGVWWIYGALLFIVALPHALLNG